MIVSLQHKIESGAKSWILDFDFAFLYSKTEAILYNIQNCLIETRICHYGVDS
jgi:hypothetical protein